MKMTRVFPLVLAAVSLLVLAWPASCSAAYGPPRPRQVLVPVTKDPSTSLYTIPVRLGTNLVVDIAGPLLWSTCPHDHLPAPFSCKSPTCRLANAYPVPGCGRGSCDTRHKVCTAHPYNPVTGACAPGTLVHSRLIANTTDGRNPVSQVSVNVVAACASKKLLKSLPRGATGVAGLAGSDLALPAQVASAQKVAKKFLLCLPRGGSSNGVAIFGGGPLFLLTEQPEYTQSLEYTPLLTKKDNPAYYVTINSIAMENALVPVPSGALANGGAVLCTRVPYTLLRADVYRPFVDAFRAGMRTVWPSGRETAAVAPFELCYNASTLANTRIGYLVPSVTLTLGGGKNWTMTGIHSMVDVKRGAACLAFVEMKGVKAGYGNAPAVLVGGFQMENFVLQFDLEKKRLGFLRLPFFTQCGHFNFTRTV